MNTIDFSKITREHIEKAIAEIDQTGVQSSAQSVYYDLVHNNKTYPPKLVISLAGKFAYGSIIPRTNFPGGMGKASFNHLIGLGFEIKKKDEFHSKLRDIFYTVMSRSKNVRMEPFKDNELATLVRVAAKQEIEQILLNLDHHKDKDVKGSVGAGNWADIFWISILNTRITTSTTTGVYVVYLFERTGQKLFLTLNQGITKIKETHGRRATEEAKKRALNIRDKLHLENYTNNINLNSQTQLGKGYEDTCIAAIEYNVDSLPNEEKLTDDLDEFMTIYENYSENIDGVNMLEDDQKEFSETNIIQTPTRLPKPFLLLAGISGTGKTRFVREQADASAKKFSLQKEENYCIVPVRPDWHEPSDLLGYISRINGTAYVPTEFLKFAVKAFVSCVESIDSGEVKWKPFDGVAPYWLCLDEMNLAPVEQYFADYLSILETRSFEDSGYKSEPLLPSSVFTQLGKAASLKLLSDLGLEIASFDKNSFIVYMNNIDLSENTVKTYLNAFDKLEDHYMQNKSVDIFELDIEKAKEAVTMYHLPSNTEPESDIYKWVQKEREKRGNGDVSAVARYFINFCNEVEETSANDSDNSLMNYILKKGIPLPPNLIVAGTVNMDETTHGFSRKVIDRALTIDFQEFFPNDFDKFFGDQSEPELFTFPVISRASRSDLPEIDNQEDGNSKSVEFIKSLNKILKNTPYELAYRALNELLLSVISYIPYNSNDEMRLRAVWDDFLMQKVLPRIEGDSQKLKSSATPENTDLLPDPNDYGKGSVLHDIYSLLQRESFEPIWDGAKRPDLMRAAGDMIECRSKKKLEWMMRRLKSTHFTDFWV